jgi:hypothetical protein
MRTLSTLVLVSFVTATLHAQSVGPDVTVSGLTDVQGYGTALGISAFAVGTVACNVGTQPVTWNASNNQHPVIAQNMYRYLNGTFQQLGMSWLKHGFVSTNSPGCGTCVQPPLGGGQLGVGCTDAYGASLNGNGPSLGPRSEVNAATGAYLFPHGSPTGNATIMARIQVQNADLGNAAAMYFVDAQYVTSDDALAGNKNNNATWQQIVTPGIGQVGNVAFIGAPHPQQPAIYAWQAVDPTVVITTVDIPHDGRFIIAKKVTPIAGGFHHEFAIHNLNSDRSGRRFTVVFAPGTVISNGGFRSIPYHSGEPYSNTPWTITISGNAIDWATQLYSVNPNANALRWGTMDNFWFDATASAEVSETLDPFKPPPPCSLQLTSPLGPGSLLVENTACANAAGQSYFMVATTHQGSYPSGWWFGVDISFADLQGQFYTGYPFTGLLDGAGASSYGPVTGLPSGVTLYAVSLNCTPGFGLVTSVRTSISYTIP